MQRDYSHELGAPEVPMCGKASLTLHFDGTWLELRQGAYKAGLMAVSGKPDKQGSFDYSAQRQRVPGQGPIPAGQYWINPAEIWERDDWNLIQQFRAPRPAWGDLRVTIHVFPGTNTFGRGGFFIHGGDVRGSAGCIDLTSSMKAFVDILRQRLTGNTNCYIELQVNYG